MVTTGSDDTAHLYVVIGVLSVLVAVGVVGLIFYVAGNRRKYKKDEKMVNKADASVSYEQL